MTTGTVPRFPDVTWLRPSPRMWSARRLELGVVSALLLVAVTVVFGVTSGAAVTVAAVVVSLAVIATSYVALHRRFRSWGYAERVDDLLIRRGVFVQRLSVVPYGRMQFVDVTAGPVDRLFKLATVQLHTAAAATDARIPGLAADEAERLRDQLAGLGEARAAGL